MGPQVAKINGPFWSVFDAEESLQETLWPSPYDEDTGEAAFRFITECWWTLNEADQKIDLVPAKPYVEALCHEWHGAFARRQAMLIEKSRRLTVSWICRGLETWQMGLAKGETHIVDQTHENSAEHLWRIHYCPRAITRKAAGVSASQARGARLAGGKTSHPLDPSERLADNAGPRGRHLRTGERQNDRDVGRDLQVSFAFGVLGPGFDCYAGCGFWPGWMGLRNCERVAGRGVAGDQGRGECERDVGVGRDCLIFDLPTPKRYGGQVCRLLDWVLGDGCWVLGIVF